MAFLSDEGIPVALVARTHPAQKWSTEWSNGLLNSLKVDDERTVMDVVGDMPLIMRDGCKASHVRSLARMTQVPFGEMLYFDDCYPDVCHVENLGVTAVHTLDGLTSALFKDGLRRYTERTPRELPELNERLEFRVREKAIRRR